jgi:hypothetical protein
MRFSKYLIVVLQNGIKGTVLSNRVEDRVNGQVGNRVEDRVKRQVGNRVEDRVKRQVGNRVEDRVKGLMRYRETV